MNVRFLSFSSIVFIAAIRRKNCVRIRNVDYLNIFSLSLFLSQMNRIVCFDFISCNEMRKIIMIFGVGILENCCDLWNIVMDNDVVGVLIYVRCPHHITPLHSTLHTFISFVLQHSVTTGRYSAPNPGAVAAVVFLLWFFSFVFFFLFAQHEIHYEWCPVRVTS